MNCGVGFDNDRYLKEQKAAIYDRLASYYHEMGRKPEEAAACPDAVAWMIRAGYRDAARGFVDEWIRRLPDDAKAKEMKAEMERAGTAH